MRRLLLSCLVLFLSALGASAQFEDSFRWGYGALDMEPGSTGTGNPGKMSVAIFVPMTEALKGAQLKHMYIPVVEDNMQDVKVWAKRSLNDAECIYEKDLSGREFDKEEHYYEFTLSDNSLVVNGNMYIGYTVTSQTGEPFGVSQGSAPGSIYISENGGEFVDYSDKGVGVLALQLFFNNLNLPENNLQKNGFFDTTPEESMIPAGDPLAAYCQGGEYGKEYFSMVFNDVAINSSYDADGNNQADALPATFAAGDHATNEYTLALPTQNILLNAINKDKVCVVALVIDENGFIANAARAKVEKADGIESVTEANGHKPMANGTFNLAGQKVNAQYKGVVISGGKKVIVK